MERPLAIIAEKLGLSDRRQLLRRLAGYPAEPVPSAQVEALFGPDYEPGTFFVSERKDRPAFLSPEENIGYHEWVLSQVAADLAEIGRRMDPDSLPFQVPPESSWAAMGEVVYDVLETAMPDGRSFSETVANQAYSDVSRRILCAYLAGNPDLEVDTYHPVNLLGREVAVALVDRLRDSPLVALLRTTIASGLIGLNLKRPASACSAMVEGPMIDLDLCARPEEQLDRVHTQLVARSAQGSELDQSEEFIAQLLDTACCQTLVFFPDDYIETILDLALVQRLLAANPKLTVVVVPRALRCGNDACVEDVTHTLRLPQYRHARTLVAQGRLQVRGDGQTLGYVDGWTLSRGVYQAVACADIVYVKGARSHEALRGLRKPTYFGIVICREFSESVTGVCADSGSVTLFRQDSGDHSFSGFRRRHLRPIAWPSGRVGWLASETVLEYRRAKH